MNAVATYPKPTRYLLEDWLDARKAKRRAEKGKRQESALRAAVTRKRNRQRKA